MSQGERVTNNQYIFLIKLGSWIHCNYLCPSKCRVLTGSAWMSHYTIRLAAPWHAFLPLLHCDTLPATLQWTTVICPILDSPFSCHGCFSKLVSTFGVDASKVAGHIIRKMGGHFDTTTSIIRSTIFEIFVVAGWRFRASGIQIVRHTLFLQVSLFWYLFVAVITFWDYCSRPLCATVQSTWWSGRTIQVLPWSLFLVSR